MIARLLDSAILIDHFNGISQSTEFLLSLDPEETAISVISYDEILRGFDEEGKRKAEPLLKSLVILSFEIFVAHKAQKLMRKYSWRLPDALQAAVAILNGIKLCTRNTTYFDPLKHPFVEIPYRIK